jgi:hypothetical protein
VSGRKSREIVESEISKGKKTKQKHSCSSRCLAWIPASTSRYGTLCSRRLLTSSPFSFLWVSVIRAWLLAVPVGSFSISFGRHFVRFCPNGNRRSARPPTCGILDDREGNQKQLFSRQTKNQLEHHPNFFITQPMYVDRSTRYARRSYCAIMHCTYLVIFEVVNTEKGASWHSRKYTRCRLPRFFLASCRTFPMVNLGS